MRHYVYMRRHSPALHEGLRKRKDIPKTFGIPLGKAEEGQALAGDLPWPLTKT